MSGAHDYGDSAIAVIGMAGRFPGAADVEAFWRNVCAGVEAIRAFSDAELLAAGADPAKLRDPAYVKAGSVLAGFDRFDAGFFGFSPREAALLDPQHRIFLECAWEALESAGYGAGYGGVTGVFAGASMTSHLLNIAAHPGLLDQVGVLQAIIGNSPDFLATRVSYKLDLDGPAYSVQTACSTSLVAVHLGCHALLSYESDMIVAGGVSVQIPHGAGYVYDEGGITSPVGRVFPFDERARGTVFGNGVGAVVLKRLEDALKDGDTVLAVIRGSATNNDGARKVGYSAPSLERQAEVIAEALANADVDADTIGHVEAHGTGTEMGDPVEVAALTQAFRATSERRGFCALTSVKGNIGHLDAAAGVVGLIKSIQALRYRRLPPSINFARPNPKIDFAGSPFYVNTELRDWPAGTAPRRAGVSSFGVGGTNVHMVLEEAPEPEPAAPSRPWQLLQLSAKSATAADAAAAGLAAWLTAPPDAGAPPPALADAAYTLQVGRQSFAHRRFVVARDAASAAAALAARPERAVCQRQSLPVAFLFPGQGAQYPEMGRELYETEPTFRGEVDRCAELLRPELGCDLRELLYPPPAALETAAARLRRTDFTQPALFVVEHALARLWMEWGVAPAAMLGHSIGEYVAACLAGVFTLAEALRLVAARGRLVQELPGGAMIAVALGEDEIASHLPPELSLAAVNAPASCTVAGPELAVAALAARLEQHGIEHHRLHTSHAFHSAMMEPALAPFRARLAGVALKPPEIPFVSNVTGRWIRPEEAVDPEYWVRHLRQTVRFADGVAELLQERDRALLEVGPGRSLATLVRRQLGDGPAPPVLTSLRHPREKDADHQRLLTSLGQLWAAGLPVDWQGFYRHEERRRVPLPTYPFERQRYWILPERRPPAAGEPLPLAAPPSVTAAPVTERPELATTYVAPASELERGVAEVGAQVLGVRRLGRDDDFFDLGGDSLLATRLLSRLRDRFRVAVPLDQLYAAPTVAGLAAAVAAAQAPDEADALPLAPVPRTGELPLSFGQERLWFLDQLNPGHPAFTLASGLRLAGALDLAAFAGALRALVARHEALRTAFTSVDGRPVQVIAPHLAPTLAVVDLSALPAPARARRTRRVLARLARQGFDLARPPLLRLALVRLAAGEHVFLIALHHIVADGWSEGVLARELGALYAAAVAGAGAPVVSPLAAPRLQYADFAWWQRRWLAGEALTAQLEHWRARLTPLPAALDLPADHPRPAALSLAGRTLELALPGELAAALEALGHRLGATFFMTLLAGLDALLHRYSQQRDLTVGTPVANRQRTELEGIVGFFVNTLVLRTDLSGDPSFRELAARVRGVTVDAYARQDVPFEKLVDALQPERDLAYSPLFQVMLILQPAPLAGAALPGLARTPVVVDTGATMLDLTIALESPGAAAEGGAAADGALRARLEYSTDLFEETTVRRLWGHLTTLLTAAAADPEVRLSRLTLLSPAEELQLLGEWSDRGVPRGAFRGLVERIAERAAAQPAAPAVVHGDTVLSYGELRRKVSLLAQRLEAGGLAAEERVGVFLERSAALPVALLGVLATAGGYVPLDPSLPEERLRFLVSDAAVARIVTHERLLPMLAAAMAESPASGGAGAILVDNDGTPARSGDPGDDDADLAPRAAAKRHSASTAYTIYTSGSTGKPKGVQVPEGALVSFLASMLREPGIGAADTLVAVTTVSFDIAGLELFLPLLAGARLVIADAQEASDGERLRALLERTSATVMQATPVTWQLLLAAGWPAAELRVLCGGEALPRELADELLRYVPEVWNLYGPTETTIWSTVARLSAGAGPVTVGRPIADTRVCVVDPRQAPVPIGVAGELQIGGAGVARGYRGRPGLTAEKFVPDPWAAAPGVRLYRTGDLARFCRGGALEVLGRRDHQVKVRGFRIELGEIESVLGRHPAVAQAVVVARQDGAGARLAAYVVAAAGATVAVDELRRHLAASLPEYMLPGVIETLPELPRLPNNKVDRSALIRRALPAAAASTAAGRPRTPVEELVAEIWSSLLHRGEVGLDESFFELGGHSLLATQVVSRLREAFGVELPVRTLFEAPTVAALAARIDGATARPPAPPLRRLPAVAAPPLSFAQQRLWLIDRLGFGATAYNLPGAVELRGRLDGPALTAALGEIVRRHEALRTRFPATDGRPAQVVADGGRLALPRLDLRALPPSRRAVEARRLSSAQAARPFDLAAGPLFRAALVQRADDEHLLLVGMHHIVADGWSLGIFLRELSALYGAYVAGAPSPLAELPVQYADFARWQRDWLTGEVLATQLDYWRRHLGGVPAPLALPFDRPRPAVQSYRGATRVSRLSPALTAAVKSLARQRGATLFMTLMAGFQTVLSRYAEQREVTVGTPIANRHHAAIEELIGLFVNTLALRVEVDEESSFAAHLARVREVTLGGYAHQDLPFEMLVDDLQPERDLSREPLFQVMFVLETPLPPLVLPGLEAELIDVPLSAAKFDLTVFAADTPSGVRLAWDYSADLFDATTVARLAAHFATLLAAAAADPERPLARLTLLSPAEEAQLTVEWNDRFGDPVPDAGVYALFAERARERPAEVAVTAGGERLTYGELHRASQRVARRLLAHGLGPEDRVGICLERSLDLPIAALAVLATAASYVPLDPLLPAERLRFILADSGVSRVLTQERLRPLLAAAAPALAAGVVTLDAADVAGAGAAEGAAVPSARSPESTAYTIYTSGSTGRPKGVQVAERSLVNFLRSMAREPGVSAADTLVAVTTFSFDIAGLELFLPLVVGARLVVAGAADAGSGERLRTLLEESGATVMQATPVTWRLLLAAGWPERGVRVLCGGEALPRELADRLLRHAPEVWNVYGPTETTIWSTVQRLTPASGPVTAGRPIANTRTVVVDRRLRPLPIGAAGELLIGGVGVARGYRRRPALTAEKFIPDPWSATPDARLYRTGDLARWRRNGELEVLGRRDYQVKVRGFRIELGEIEAVLSRHPAVAQAVVVAQPTPAGDARLVAYVEGAAGQQVDAGELRRHLAATLPEYMVPGVYVPLAALPRLPNGKVDRQALPAASPGAPPSRERVAPRNPVEARLAEIWRQTLGLPEIGVHDNFFELGGDSILSIQIVARAHQAGFELLPRALFQHQTIAELAAFVASDAALATGEPPAIGAAPPASYDFPLSDLDRSELDQVRAQGTPIEDVYPLSQVQEGMLFHTLYQQSSGVYVEQLTCQLAGALDPALFAQAWRELAALHGVLRTFFLWERLERPLQLVAESAPIELVEEDWRALAPAERAARFAAYLAEDRRRGFELATPPLMRLALLRVGERRHTFLWTYHHLLLDGWSASAVLRDVLALYQARQEGGGLELERPRPFRDYVAWLQQQDSAGAEAYWRESLRGFTAATPLKLERPAAEAAVSPPGRGDQQIRLSAEVTAALETLRRRHRLTLNTVVQGAWALLLHRYSGRDDVLFGATVSGRAPELRGIESMVGVFINTLPVRIRVDAESRLLPWLGEVQRQHLDRQQHQYTPLSKMQGLSDVARGEPLFDSMLVFESYPIDESLRRQGGAIEIREPRFIEWVDNALVVIAEPGTRLLLRVGYDRQRFADTAVGRLLGHLETLFADLVADPERRLRELAVLSAGERQQLLREWNDPAVEYPAGGCLHHLVAAQADARPDAVAVVAEQGSLSYRALDREANRLAHHLRARGVRAETLVGVAFERRPEMVAALVGILKAGGAYVPLDPDYPAERLATILRNAGVEVLVTEERLRARFPSAGEVLVYDRAALAGAPSAAPAELVGPENLAYVIHTSGSTGTPKGVMIPHRGVVNRLVFAPAAGHLRPGDRFLQKASIGFDVSVLELFLPLLAGGSVVLARPGGQQDPAYLARWMVDARVDQAIFPPSLLGLLLEEEAITACRSLHSVASSAEALPVELQRRFSERLAADLYNRYGPTEASIAASSWKCARAQTLSRVPIGRPIARARLFLVSRQLQVAAAGIPGELLIGGVGLARGYHGQAARTAEAFIPDPFGAAPGKRLYKTGDLARYRHDGAVEFLGRVDSQVKVRGFRVELGEIEAALSRHPGVRAAVVVDRDDLPGGQKRLVAYLVLRDAPATTIDELRQGLKQQLPEYMIPAVFMELPALPLLPSGKVDRRGLPAPEVSRAQLAAGDYEAPRTPVEEVLARLWSEMLGVERVGVHDDFFELGGDSILSIRIVSRCHQEGVRITLRQLFECRTVARLAEVADAGPGVLAEQGVIVGDAPLTPVQRRFFEHPLPEPHYVNQALMLEVQGELPPPVLTDAVRRLLEHHDALRLRFTHDEAGWRQRFAAPDGDAPVSRLDLSWLGGAARQHAIEVAAARLQASLDLEVGPLLRVAVFHLGHGAADRLLIAVHHLAIDGVSWRVLLEDLEAACRQRLEGQEISLPSKTTSYRQWAERLSEWAVSPELRQKLEPWRQMKPEPRGVRLPIDLTDGRAENTVASTRSLTVALEVAETDALLREVPEAYRTQINDALLAALVQAFTRWSGAPTLWVDLESHGRDHPFADVDLSRTVGWHTAIFPVLLHADARSAVEVLKQTKERLRAVPDSGLPYGVARYLAPEVGAELGALPPAEVSFNYLGQLDGSASASSLFKPAAESTGPSRSRHGVRRYLLEINGAVQAGRLELEWSYSENVHRRETIESLAHGYLEALRSLISACGVVEAVGYTPSDFPDVELDQSALDDILDQIEVKGIPS